MKKEDRLREILDGLYLSAAASSDCMVDEEEVIDKAIQAILKWHEEEIRRQADE